MSASCATSTSSRPAGSAHGSCDQTATPGVGSAGEACGDPGGIAATTPAVAAGSAVVGLGISTGADSSRATRGRRAAPPAPASAPRAARIGMSCWIRSTTSPGQCPALQAPHPFLRLPGRICVRETKHHQSPAPVATSEHLAIGSLVETTPVSPLARRAAERQPFARIARHHQWNLDRPQSARH